jgi:hypothetical protein
MNKSRQFKGDEHIDEEFIRHADHTKAGQRRCSRPPRRRHRRALQRCRGGVVGIRWRSERKRGLDFGHDDGGPKVAWTSSTTFSETVTETESAVAVGDCLTVTGTPTKKSKTKVTARSITISQPSSSGKCATGLGGAGSIGGRPSGTGGAPSGSGGFPGGGSGPPSGSSGSGSKGRGSIAGVNVTIASGQVTAVSGASVSLSGTLLSGFSRPTKSTKKVSTPKTQKLKITMDNSTTLSETQSTAASSLAVGDCVSAFGQSGSTGDVTATTVTITSTGGKTCSAGFGAGGFGGA